jgi:glycosyltransferase involved in cell wall biosynthesis
MTYLEQKAMNLEYVIITPARNEAALIEQTIRSVVAQTVLPNRWLIVSDGSTDETDAIVQRYLPDHPWMELLRLPAHRDRSFAAKAHVFNAGYAHVAPLAFDVIGNLDADITVPPDYFEFLMQRFKESPDLGVAGTHYIEDEFHSYRDSYINVEHVNGGCQLFRRACYEAVGGYIPIRGGGVDWAAVTMARMKGWKTRSFGERVFHHHRKIGTAETNQLMARFNYGKKDYFLGSHPLWEAFRGAFQMAKKPYVIGGVCLMAGYMWAWVSGHRRPIPDELVRFYRREQLGRLRDLIGNRFRPAR